MPFKSSVSCRLMIVLSIGGDRIASSNKQEVLLDEDFQIVINDDVFTVKVPKKPSISKVSDCKIGKMVFDYEGR